MNRKRSIRSMAITGAVAVLGMGLMAVAATPAFATAVPRVDGPVPQSGPTAGGSPVRIYGSAFSGATAVKFGTVAATSYHIVDDQLITAVVPAASGGTGDNNTLVDVKVTTSGGTGTQTGGFYYTNATLSVTPNTGLADGNTIAITLAGYATTTVIVPEFNPLQIYLEGTGTCSTGASPTCPPAFPAGPPPYAKPLGGSQMTVSGGLSYSPSLPNPFTGTSGSSYDANIKCPVTQTTANYLGTSDAISLNKPSYSARCHLAVGQFGSGTIETPLGYTADLTPAAPVLVTNTGTAHAGNTVTITATSSVNWNANPFYGSSKTHTNPGETAVTVQICGIGGVNTACSATVGTGTISMTRYETSSTTKPITATFSGAKASGSIVVGNDIGTCTTCFVQVTQTRPAGGTISATAALSVS